MDVALAGERLRREAGLFAAGALPRAGEASARIAEAVAAIAAALEAEGAAAARRALAARRKAAAAERGARALLEAALAEPTPGALKARALSRGLSEAADLVERAAELVLEELSEAP